MAIGQIKQAQARIDQKQFENLCAIQCTRDEICSIFGVDDNTLIRWCKEHYDGKDFGTVFQEKRKQDTSDFCHSIIGDFCLNLGDLFCFRRAPCRFVFVS